VENIDLKPTGLVASDFVDCIYLWWAAFKGICAKLDDDTGVTATTYEALCYTAIFNGCIEDTRGGQLINAVSTKAARFYHITPRGYDDPAILECFYDMLDAMETLSEKLDLEGLTFTNYEAIAYTAICTQKVMNQTGESTLGNGSAAFTFRPGGICAEAQIVEFMYNAFEFIHLLTSNETTSGLDGDGTVTDTDYEELWYTDALDRVIMNSVGSTIGNARTF